MTEPSFGDSFEIVPPANGVPRSAWFRTRRMSTWHRPYAVVLLFLDYAAVALANLVTISFYEKAPSGFQGLRPLFDLIAYVFLPLAWLVVLWGNGAYDRRYLGIGTDEFKRVMRTTVTLTATLSLLAFLTQKAGQLSRLSVLFSMLGGLFFIAVFRYGARRGLSLVRRKGRASHRMLLVGSLNEALEVFTAVTRNPAAGMTPIAIHVSDGYPTARHTQAPVPVHAGRDAVGLILFFPVLVAIAIGIKAVDRGPVFFRQSRVGREGETFRVWKFRTMYVDAEERRATLVDQNESDGLLFKIKDDPRITPFGRILRASSLDELPQLINVLLWGMSLG